MSNYRIRQGDTLSALASRFKTSVSELARVNNISNPNLIYAGKTLRIPGHARNDSFQPTRGHGPRGGGHTGGTSGGGQVQGSHGTASPGQVTPAMRKLASAGRAAAMSIGGYNSQGLCATGVSKAIQNAFGFKVWGNGNQIDNNLPRDKFKQVNMSLEQALKIPGLVLTWEKTSSRLGSIYGHTAITTGDGRSSVSDFIERNTLGAGGRSGLKIFMPTM
ncbi:MAG TPA: LysM peptidoglycan-binding domain-containing protein [Archangium sp.]|uniref:LysM peptidoglycan-binding domain-containing protein n=1 Tax=Archangium sp. TaxID=1872627 RepID=UPI002E2F2491|nr:LysM peptidoglycan-binding domain-containing protein [Archangium sp.]HEX5749934.1 LysM peptidoglycan-binding domain-containing protein [Archangium sp.]